MSLCATNVSAADFLTVQHTTHEVWRTETVVNINACALVLHLSSHIGWRTSGGGHNEYQVDCRSRESMDFNYEPCLTPLQRVTEGAFCHAQGKYLQLCVVREFF